MIGGRDQAGACAGGDVVGRDKRTNITVDLRRPAGSSKIDALKARLLAEIAKDAQVGEIINDLQRYHNRRQSIDGVEGLEPKLRVADREAEILDALEQKEMFAKLLDKWALYASAQEIFVHLLSLAVHEFRMQIQPLLANLDRQTYNDLVTNRIVRPLMDEVGDCPLSMDAMVTMGLYYWLAEQCFVRWHA
ncbi:hypothetical protein JK217_11105 [Gluconobacter kondonii]|uniref:ABC-three component system protein n=1 Tax=Gluconobacter kondonii TaxID=941463 RepID=UPI001B8C4BAD|nr:ABC-three component system protein [Gluconobacter kondonii]MBS1078287.1 hypothetical protein [Gluconobacter kondonii]